MRHLYGEFADSQIKEYKNKLHKDLFWLILYKDPNTKDNYVDVDFDKYFTFLMKKIDGLNELLNYPPVLVDLLSTLEAAYIESRVTPFAWADYRKLVFDAQNLVDKLGA